MLASPQPDPEPDREPSGLIGSAQRALRVLEVVAAAGDAITAKAVARRAGFKLSTTYHLLNTLEHEGYLVRLGHGMGFRLGDKIGSLSRHRTADGARCASCGVGPQHVDSQHVDSQHVDSQRHEATTPA